MLFHPPPSMLSPQGLDTAIRQHPTPIKNQYCQVQVTNCSKNIDNWHPQGPGVSSCTFVFFISFPFTFLQRLSYSSYKCFSSRYLFFFHFDFQGFLCWLVSIQYLAVQYCIFNLSELCSQLSRKSRNSIFFFFSRCVGLWGGFQTVSRPPCTMCSLFLTLAQLYSFTNNSEPSNM